MTNTQWEVETKLCQECEHKRGLVQDLLTGKVRVNDISLDDN